MYQNLAQKNQPQYRNYLKNLRDYRESIFAASIFRKFVFTNLLLTFFESQFRYCSLTWMFHSRKSNNKINLLHERTLRMIYNDRISSFQELLEKDNSCTVHHFNVLSLAFVMFKVISNIAATIIDDLFITYLRSKFKFAVPSVRSVHNGQNSIQYYGPLILNAIPGYIKDSETLDIFKGKIRK